MKHAGRARKTAFKIILFSMIATLIILALGIVAFVAGTTIIGLWPFVVALWLVFAVFTLYFFRDPEPRVPVGDKLVLAPGHGKVDVIDTTTEPLFMGGECRRVSIFLSVIDIHVQNAPVSGVVEFVKYTTGEFISALKTECATC